MIDSARQRAALGSILKILEPGSLDVPESVLEILLPRPFGHPPNRELLESRTDPAFDPMGAARAAASMAVAVLLQPERTARLVDFHRREPSRPGLEWLLAGLIEKTFRDPPAGSPAAPRLAALSRVVRGAVVDGLLDLSAHPRVTTDVRAMVDLSLAGLKTRLESGRGSGFQDEAHNALLAARIGRYLARDLRDGPAAPWTAPPPPGSPIGAGFLPPDLAGCSLEALP
jgi:hypothetical protein